MLKVDRISVFYGQIQALWDVSIEVELGEIVAIIGANGAGKTSLIKTVMGINKPASGSIWFNDMNITKEPTHSIVKNGVTCIPEGRRVFPKLTVRENLEMGCYSKRLNKNLMEDNWNAFIIFFLVLRSARGN